MSTSEQIRYTSIIQKHGIIYDICLDVNTANINEIDPNQAREKASN